MCWFSAYTLIDWISQFHSFVQWVFPVKLNQFHKTLKLSSANCEESTFTLYPAVLDFAFSPAIKWTEV